MREGVKKPKIFRAYTFATSSSGHTVALVLGIATSDAFSAYVAEGGDDAQARRPVYCPEFGLSIEELKDGYTLESLWQILPPDPNKKLLE